LPTSFSPPNSNNRRTIPSSTSCASKEEPSSPNDKMSPRQYRADCPALSQSEVCRLKWYRPAIWNPRLLPSGASYVVASLLKKQARDSYLLTLYSNLFHCVSYDRGCRLLRVALSPVPLRAQPRIQDWWMRAIVLHAQIHMLASQ
jgi:hypothetical protein